MTTEMASAPLTTSKVRYDQNGENGNPDDEPGYHGVGNEAGEPAKPEEPEHCLKDADENHHGEQDGVALLEGHVCERLTGHQRRGAGRRDDHQLTAAEEAGSDRAGHAGIKAVDRIDPREEAARHSIRHIGERGGQASEAVPANRHAARAFREMVGDRLAEFAQFRLIDFGLFVGPDLVFGWGGPCLHPELMEPRHGFVSTAYATACIQHVRLPSKPHNRDVRSQTADAAPATAWAIRRYASCLAW
jgi:hypothetical protein